MRTVAAIVLTLVVYPPCGGAEGDAESDPLFRDSVLEYLPPGTIIMVGDSSVEHLYEKGEKVGPPDDEVKLDFDVEVSDWVKYRKLEEATRGVYYDCVEVKDMGPETERHHKRTYDVVFCYSQPVTYYGPWYINNKLEEDPEPPTYELGRESRFKAYGVNAGVTVGVDFYDDGEAIYDDEKEYKGGRTYPPYNGEQGRAWNYFITEGSYYGVPWGKYEDPIPDDYEWDYGWRNLEYETWLRNYPDEDDHWPSGILDAQYYLRFNGAVRKRNQLGWTELPPANGGKILPDPAWYYKEEQWPGAAGKAWLDDAIFKEVDDAPIFINKDNADGGFEESEGEWHFGNEPYVNRLLSNKAYADDNSGLLERFDNPNPLTWAALKHFLHDGIDDYIGFEATEKIKIGGRLRTKLVDCQRFVSPWQWHLSAKELGELDPYDEDDDGRILGCNNEMMTNLVFPGTFTLRAETRLQWKPQISDINVAEWGWSTYNPYVWDDPDTTEVREDVWETPKLYNFWYRPIFLFESESVRHEKKAIYEYQ